MFNHVHKFSSELTKSDIFQISNIFFITFRQLLPEDYIQRKFIENPFGDSIHILSYDSCHNLVATRALWKLDSSLYYQCVDTAVHPFCQGGGVFRHSTEYILSTFPDLCFYNKPNSNSLPQYLKYGWKIDKKQRLGVSSRFSTSFLSSIPHLNWSKSQLNWRITLKNDITYYHFFHKGLYYVSTKKRRFFDMLLFKTPIRLDLPTSHSVFFFTFDSNTLLHFPYNQILLSRCSGSYAPPSFYFDMT